MKNIVLLAGEGSRFQKEGYDLPKPLIEVSGKPMIIKACESLPESKDWIFLCRREHIEKFQINSLLKSEFKNPEIIIIDKLTDGQASTCLIGLETLNNNEAFLVSACDNGMIWDKTQYNSFIQDQSIDAIIWTFRKNSLVNRNPNMYGWVETKEDLAVRVSCKVPISKNPVMDHAIIGTFYFRNKNLYETAYQSMVKKNRRINNEFYIDELMNELIESGKKVKVFEVGKYLCWGTPNDLKVYQYWERFFKQDYNMN